MENPKVQVWIEGDIIFEKVSGTLDENDVHFSTEHVTAAAEEMATKGIPAFVAIDVSEVKGVTREGRAAMAKDFDNTKMNNGGGVVMYGMNSFLVATIKLLAFISPLMKTTKFVSTKEQAVAYLRGLVSPVD
jgi:hypothetical protein